VIKVSVIIPTYNRADTLKAAIKSALEQSYPVHEVLVCDDGSTDSTHDFVLSFNDERVKWIPGDHAGRPALPRNRGIKFSSGNWLAFLDSDDTWHFEKIQTQYNLLKNLNCKAVCSNALRIVNGEPSNIYFAEGNSTITFKDLIISNKVICSSALIEKSIVLKIGFFSEDLKFKAIEDYSYWLKAATYTDWGYCHEALVNYSDDPKNSIRSNIRSEHEQRITIFEEYINWNVNSKSFERTMAKKARRQLYYMKWYHFLKKIFLFN
jgi:teichuronic acid biosynthesis glycosyltransferase TuaG